MGSKSRAKRRRRLETQQRKEKLSGEPGSQEMMVPNWILQVMLLFVGIIGGGAFWYFVAQKDLFKAWWVGTIGAVLLVLTIALFIRNGLISKEIEARKPVFFGELVPANEPAPELPPDVPTHTVQLLLGDELRVLSANSDNYIFSRKAKPYLSIGLRNERMRISATIMDSTNRYVVRIIDNEFQVNPEAAFKPRQPDEHSLVVRDGEGVQVLSIRFLNPRAIRIVGRFHLPGYAEPIVIDPDFGVRWPGGGGIGRLTIDLTRSKAGFIAF